MPFILISGFLFVLGAVVGSFLNVCIHRLPSRQSIVSPSSYCPKCNRTISWYDNIPIVSFFLLKGCCRHCGGRISPRYFVVEFITGLLYLWVWLYYGYRAEGLVCVILVSLLLVATFVDIEHQIIPDEVSLGGLGAGILLSGFIPSLHGEAIWWRGVLDAVLGALLGGVLIYVTGVIGTLIFRKESMGGGDVKLMALLGAFVGWQKVILIYLLAPILALPLGLFLKLSRRSEVIAFGPFISLAGWISFIWGGRLIAWYWNRMGF